jgi:hypothetical protein
MAFPLTAGPFGEQPFDALSDQRTASTYRDGYSAYLYLGPLRDELFSPLIAGFYTDEFVSELDRRHRLSSKKGLVESYRLPELDAPTFIGWMGSSWGKPRRKWQRLGPINAWHHGDGWKEVFREEQHKYALEHPEVITQAAQRLLDEIRAADYSRGSADWQNFILAPYQVARNYPSWVRWICDTFEGNPIASVELGEVFENAKKLPTVSYKLTLKDGTILEGDLPFRYDPMLEEWEGIAGLDWHLKGRRRNR